MVCRLHSSVIVCVPGVSSAIVNYFGLILPEIGVCTQLDTDGIAEAKYRWKQGYGFIRNSFVCQCCVDNQVLD